jgi:predicted acyltransferase
MSEATAPEVEVQEQRPVAATPTTQRLMSIDALRGFDMFWIVGADSLVYALHHLSENRATSFLAYQLDHAEWEGFHFYDLIFPLFVFISGVSIVFSLTRIIQQHGRAQAIMRVMRRSVLLFILALVYSGGASNSWPDIRLLGVLNRIALCYLFGGTIFCLVPWRGMIAIAVSLLLGYWALMAWVPIRDIRLAKYPDKDHVLAANDIERMYAERGTRDAAAIFYSTTNWVTGKYDKGYNLANHLDFQYLPGRRWDFYWDPEGCLSTMPAICTCLLGIFAGLLLRNGNVCDERKVIYLISFGAAGVLLGFLWGTEFPVVKKIWTSSYVLIAGGYSAILLGAFYYVVDILKFQKWCQPFVWMGMNSITIYMTKNFLGGSFSRLASRLVGGDVETYINKYIATGLGEVVLSITSLLLAFWFMHFLYRRKIFLRL